MTSLSLSLQYLMLDVRLEIYSYVEDGGIHRPHVRRVYGSTAAVLGDLEALEEMKSQNKLQWCEDLCRFAVEGGDLKVLQWLRKNKCPWDETTIIAAAKKGNLLIMNWIRKNECPWTKMDELYFLFIEFGGSHSLALVQWLRNAGWSFSEESCTEAVRSGRLDVLQWLRSEGCTCNIEKLYRAAAANGYREIIEWLKNEGYSWNSSVCSAAAMNGHLDLLQWLRKEGCPWD